MLDHHFTTLDININILLQQLALNFPVITISQVGLTASSALIPGLQNLVTPFTAQSRILLLLELGHQPLHPLDASTGLGIIFDYPISSFIHLTMGPPATSQGRDTQQPRRQMSLPPVEAQVEEEAESSKPEEESEEDELQESGASS